ncbi:hypothetical protein CAPTEDRAFT_196164 [Capitella teleta]|uniref:Sushi domain-containing protein n=1 Tax=Capitella teleta TaxID=283909 RepID=R7TZU7_CAPTE|nr:hypothetical protein CAPTEDRAFT_196164 [Capitella teleta]|eukprot:ELT99473.1 hypothetical protein CAPTEDRAFT_196164 [Capitella teleta]
MKTSLLLFGFIFLLQGSAGAADDHRSPESTEVEATSPFLPKEEANAFLGKRRQKRAFFGGLFPLIAALTTFGCSLAEKILTEQRREESGVTKCTFPDPIFNGHVQPLASTYNIGERVHFSCKPGFGLKGRRSKTCQSNGEWDSANPTCKRLSLIPERG